MYLDNIKYLNTSKRIRLCHVLKFHTVGTKKTKLIREPVIALHSNLIHKIVLFWIFLLERGAPSRCALNARLG